jgi:hypothetical protein
MTTSVVYVGNANVIELRGLKLVTDNTYVNDADVTVTVKDSAGADATGQAWPTTMDYVAASNGVYRAIVENDVDLVADATYYAFIDADSGANQVGHWEFAFVPKIRRGT